MQGTFNAPIEENYQGRKEMTYSDIYNLIAETEGGESNVEITSKLSKKKYKQNLYISSANRLKIRGYNTKIAGYNVTEEMAEHWDNVRVMRKRERNKQ